MAGRALVVGGTGLAGRAIAVALVQAGWDTAAASRGRLPVPEVLTRAGVRILELDSSGPGELASTVRSGVDLLVQAAAYTAQDAEEILHASDKIGSAIVLSTMSVYVDDLGRSLDESTGTATDPRPPVPIPETQPTLPPGERTYSTRKVAMEQRLLGQDKLPVTILRPGAIHGRGDTQPREWHFVKRALDGRPRVVVAHNGESRFSVTSLPNLAALVLRAADQPGTRVLNAVDSVTPTVTEIAQAIARAVGHSWEVIGVPGDPPAARSPWTQAHPFVGDMTLAQQTLGHRDLTTYAEAVVETCRALVAEAGPLGEHTFPGLADCHFDYAAEDELLRGLATGGSPSR